MAEVAGAALDQRFPKTSRLRKRGEFLRAQREGAGARGAHAVVVVRPRGDDDPARLGLVASRKVGTAVERNRAKRRVREWFRRSRGSLPAGIDVVVILQPSAHRVPSSELYAMLDAALKRAARKAHLAHSHTPPHSKPSTKR